MDDVTRLPPRCPRCGNPLPPDAPEGLCAACLLIAGAQPLTQFSSDDLPTVSSAGPISTSTAGDGPRLVPDTLWGPYRIGRLLGRGGMGEVYEAEHTETGRRIALKVLRSRLQGAEDRARFLREGQLAASISHPHTVYIFGSEEIGGTPVISMELLPGGTLKDHVAARGPLPPREATAAVLDVIGGLDAAQAAGILHRDIKPSNCFLDSEGSVKVGDFGLSISTLARDVRHGLEAGSFQGTPQFAAPEQLRGEPLDVRADIYAVGATLYYLLTGRPPFEGTDLRELVARVSAEPPVSPRALRRDIPPGLASLVLDCLAKSPAHRPASYAGLADRLRPFSTIDHAPAPLGARLVAGVVDSVILSVPVIVWTAGAVDPLTSGTPSEIRTGARVASIVAGFAYYLCFEGIWRASPGKHLLGLRVVGKTGPTWWSRILLRTLIFLLPGMLVVTAAAVIGPHPVLAAEYWGIPLQSVASGTLFAALFLTARRRNGWAAAHDLVSGTAVVTRSAAVARRLDAHTASPAPAETVAPVEGLFLGPFRIVADAGQCGRGRLFVGFDPILRRRAWIVTVPPGMPATDAPRRDVGRVGRLYWLTGRRSASGSHAGNSGHEGWDAFEAPNGEPLLARLNSGAPAWPTAKQWLLDLADELDSSSRDGSMPALAVDRLWLRSDGRLVLLDFPAPGVQAPPSGTVGLSPAGLLSAVATRWLSMSTATPGRVPILPLSARALIESWSNSTLPALDEARTRLTRAAHAPDTVSRRRRAVPMALASVPILVLVVISLLLAPYLARFAASRNAEVVTLLEMLRQKPPEGSRLADPEIRSALERYIVGRHGDLLRDESFWSMPVMRGQLGELRKVATGITARHPAVSAEELTRASGVVAPEIARNQRSRVRDQEGLLGIVSVIITALAAVATGLLVLANAASSILAPGGIVTRLLGLAVVTRNGKEVSRWRSLTRVVVAWLPAIAWLVYLGTGPRVQGWVPAPPSPLVGTSLALGAMSIGAIWAIVRPNRGLHDRLVGTWVVPR